MIILNRDKIASLTVMIQLPTTFVNLVPLVSPLNLEILFVLPCILEEKEIIAIQATVNIYLVSKWFTEYTHCAYGLTCAYNSLQHRFTCSLFSNKTQCDNQFQVSQHRKIKLKGRLSIWKRVYLSSNWGGCSL